jgi:hypothetical protein
MKTFKNLHKLKLYFQDYKKIINNKIKKNYSIINFVIKNYISNLYNIFTIKKIK